MCERCLSSLLLGINSETCNKGGSVCASEGFPVAQAASGRLSEHQKDPSASATFDRNCSPRQFSPFSREEGKLLERHI